MRPTLLLLISLLYSTTSQAMSCRNSPLFKELKELAQSCANKKVHLSFDDGPDPKVTPLILKELNDRNVKSTFYVSTTNLEPGKINDTLVSMIRTGHVVASHGHEHRAHDLRLLSKQGKTICDPKILSHSQSERQIERSLSLLNSATRGLSERQPHKLFRFPYGRGSAPSKKELALILRHGQSDSACESKSIKSAPSLDQKNYKDSLNEYRRYRSKALQRVHESSRDHVGWNFDSQDSSTEVAKKATQNPDWYVKRTLTRMCESRSNVLMSLFHDNKKKFNAKAIGQIIDVGKCLGMDFVSYDEILNHKDYLKNEGVLQEAPDEKNDILGSFIEELIVEKKLEMAQAPQCGQEQSHPSNYCLSSNGNRYGQCEGESSVCVNGKWFPRGHEESINKCGFRSCYSSYAKKSFRHCEGENTICVNGAWKSPREAKSVCSK